MSKKEFSVLFETPEYIQTSVETETLFEVIKEQIAEEFNEENPKASDVDPARLKDYQKTIQCMDLVAKYVLKINNQLDQISERQAEIFAMITSEKKDD